MWLPLLSEKTGAVALGFMAGRQAARWNAAKFRDP